MELLLAAAFITTMGASSGPEVTLFKQFKVLWESINTMFYEPGIAEKSVCSMISEETSHRMMQFASNYLKKKLPRDDYLELLELTILFLGGTPPRGAKFCAPGPVHYARWMSKLLCALRIWMFWKQCSLIAQEEEALKELFFLQYKSILKLGLLLLKQLKHLVGI